MRVVAILASYNEDLFIRACLDNFIRQGVEAYRIDNASTDDTVKIARQYLGRGLIAIETLPRHGMYEWRRILRRKEEVADELKADWLIHADPDEIRLSPRSNTTLKEAFEEVDREGFNAVNFLNFLFLPTIEHPDHEGSDFQKTMRWYRHIAPTYPFQVKAWKRQKQNSASARVKGLLKFAPGRSNLRRTSVDLTSSGGHMVRFEGLKLYPVDFKMRHYPVLSLEHAIRKYVKRTYDPDEVKMGWHGWKAIAKANNLRLPSEREMRLYTSDDELDPSDPLKQSLIFAA